MSSKHTRQRKKFEAAQKTSYLAIQTEFQRYTGEEKGEKAQRSCMTEESCDFRTW
jgi:hypothetical protein